MGAEIIINISASPFVKGKNRTKIQHISTIAKKNTIPIIYVNQVGGNDSLIFDGGSFVVDKNGNICARAERFQEELVVIDTDNLTPVVVHDETIEDIEKALVLGIQDYCRKCGFKKAVVGLSGGIDSAVTAVLAVKALGSENVTGITMPSRYSSPGSVSDSIGLSRSLSMRIETLPIENIFKEYLKDLEPFFSGTAYNVAEENLQARIRGTLLMAYSNKFGGILLTTGNKSEMAMGYCTLYGDMNGGLAVISDLPKTMVYTLARFINRKSEIIPVETIEKPPSAELRENQKDQDTLPPYDILDGILEYYIENRMSKEDIINQGYDGSTVDFVLRTVDRNEYKRRQAAPGLKVTSKAFGLGRRIPMAMKLEH